MHKIIGLNIWVFLVVGLYWGCKEQMVSDNRLEVIAGYDEEARPNGMDLGIASFGIVPLETIPESILSDIVRLKITDSLILVQDHARLLAFDKTGKFQRAYGSKGRGPGEYLSLNTFLVNPGEQTVTILDEYLKKLITYRMNGDLLTEKTYRPNAFAMTHSAVWIDQENILSESYVFNRQNTIYATLNLKTGQRKSLYKLPVRSKNVAMPIGKKPISSFRDTIKLILPFDPRIYSLQDTGLIPLLKIQTQQETVPVKRLEAEENFSISTYLDIYQDGYFLGFKDICETENHILLNEAGGGKYFLIDKRQNKGVLYQYSPGEKLEKVPVLGIMASDSTHFIGYYDNFSLRRLLDLIPPDCPDPNLAKLKEVVEDLEEDANPCLLFYEFQ